MNSQKKNQYYERDESLMLAGMLIRINAFSIYDISQTPYTAAWGYTLDSMFHSVSHNWLFKNFTCPIRNSSFINFW